MGITGLLPFLKKIHVPTNISQFQGATVAVDVYCWLHKGAFSCAEKLAFGEDTDQYIYYCMKYVNFMISKNLKPILVFDGCHLPSKKDVEDSRRERRKVYRQKAAQFLKEGKRSEAKECLQRCVDITPDMARKLIEVCQKQGIDCIVAPYEADAQLAYLAQSGIAQIVVTEDSDLLLFGCDKVIFKMDFYGNGIMIEKSRLNEVVDIRDGFYTFSKFRQMCILSGCDYLSSLPGIGLANACKVFKLARQADLRQLLRKIPSYLKKSFSVPNDYIEGFIRAENTFLYQLIFDPLTRKLVPLNPYAEDLRPDDLRYAGEYIPTSEAFNIALGNTDIQTRKKLSNFNPDTDLNPGPEVAAKYNGPHMLSIWNRNYRILSKGLQEKSPLKERPSLKNKEIVTEFKVAHQPRKRLRNVENCLESKSDNELSHIYSLESPSVKKTKLPPEVDENACVFEESVLILTSLLNKQDDESSNNNKPTTDEECLETDFTSIKESKISHLDTNPSSENQNPDSMAVLSKENSSQIQEAAAKQTDTKQKLNSTHQNKFAIFKEVKRFDINAPKVQSRYFRSEKEEEKKEDNVTTNTSRLSQLIKEETACSKLIEDKSANNNNGDDDDDDDDKIEENNNNKKNNNSQNVSPSGVNKEIKHQNKTLSVLSAFSWGKRRTSYSKLTPEPVPQGSDDEVCELLPIPQVSDGTQEAASPTDWTSDTRANSTMNSLENGSELFDSGIGCSPPALSRNSSRLEADIIDLDTGSQQSVMGLESVSQQSVMGLETGSQQSVMGLETCSQDTVFGLNSLFLSSQETQSSRSETPMFNIGTPRISTAASKSPKTPKCRVSGLSKKTTKKSSSVAAVKKLNGQQSIKDMFAKFTYTKESKSRMA